MLLKAKFKDKVTDQQQRARASLPRQAQPTALASTSGSVASFPYTEETPEEKKKTSPLTLAPWNLKNIWRTKRNITQTDTRTEHNNTVGIQFDAPKKRKLSFATDGWIATASSQRTAKVEAETAVDRSGASVVLMVPQSLGLSTFILPKQVTINMKLPWQKQEGGNSNLSIPVEYTRGRPCTCKYYTYIYCSKQ